MMQLFSLAPELVCQVLSTACTSYRDAIEVMVSCKAAKAFFDPRSGYGQRLWSCVRAGEHLPDGKAAGFDDYTVLRRFFGRGCDMCSNHPRVRNVYWAFNGRRLCSTCLKRNSSRLSELSSQEMNLLRCFRSFIREWNARWHSGNPWAGSSVLFWKEDLSAVRDAVKLHGPEAAGSQLPSLTPSKDVVEKFTKDVRVAKEKRSRLADEIIATAQSSRKAALDAFIQRWADMPLVGTLLEGTWVYQKAILKTKPFTSRCEKSFVTELERELTDRKAYFAFAQLRCVARMRHGPKLLGSPEWNAFKKSEKRAKPGRNIPTVAEAEVIVDGVESLRMRRVSTIDHWKVKYVDPLPDGPAKRCVLSSAVFLGGRAEDEGILSELIDLYIRPVGQLPTNPAALPEGVSTDSIDLFCHCCGYGRRRGVDFYNFREHIFSSGWSCTFENCRKTRRFTSCK